MGCRRKNTLCLSLDFGANDGTLLPRLTRLETSPSPQKRLVLKFPSQRGARCRVGYRAQKTRVNNNARLILRGKSLTGQRHDRVQTESQIATVDSCFDLVGSLQHGVASCEVFSWSTDIHKPTICRW